MNTYYPSKRRFGSHHLKFTPGKVSILVMAAKATVLGIRRICSSSKREYCQVEFGREKHARGQLDKDIAYGAR